MKNNLTGAETFSGEEKIQDEAVQISDQG